MIRGAFAAVAAGTLAAIPAVAASHTSVATWAPSSKWTVDYGDEFCTLARDFSSADGTLTFSYRSWLAAPGARITIKSTVFVARRQRKPAQVTLQPGAQSFKFEPPSDPQDGTAPDTIVLSAPGKTFQDALPQSTGMTIAAAGVSPLALSYDRAKGAMTALKTCEDEQLRAGGLDPATVVSIPSQQLLTLSYDYPTEAIRARAAGRAIVAVSFARNGSAQGCKTIKSSGNSALDRATCIAAVQLRLDTLRDGPDVRWGLVPIRWTLPGR